MPKMKTHKSSAKRFKVSGTGKLMRAQSGRSHLNVHKSSKRKRSLDSMTLVSTANYDKIMASLPYPKYSR